MEQEIDILENLIKVVSLLDKTDEYLDSLTTRLSKCDSLISDYEHFIENMPIEKVNLKQLYLDMQNNFIVRRNIKKNMALRDNLQNSIQRLNNTKNRSFLIQSIKNVKSKLDTKYNNRVLTDDDTQKLINNENTKKKRGRPKKKEGNNNV